MKWHITGFEITEITSRDALHQRTLYTAICAYQSVMQLQRSVAPTNIRPVCAFACGHPRSFRQQDGLQVLRLSSTLTSRNRRGRPYLAPRAAAVETDDKFRLSHSVSTNTFEVKGDLEKVFTYAADFSHISGWDSGMSCTMG